MSEIEEKFIKDSLLYIQKVTMELGFLQNCHIIINYINYYLKILKGSWDETTLFYLLLISLKIKLIIK